MNKSLDGIIADIKNNFGSAYFCKFKCSDIYQNIIRTEFVKPDYYVFYPHKNGGEKIYG